jgi:hypothetical protein
MRAKLLGKRQRAQGLVLLIARVLLFGLFGLSGSALSRSESSLSEDVVLERSSAAESFSEYPRAANQQHLHRAIVFDRLADPLKEPLHPGSATRVGFCRPNAIHPSELNAGSRSHRAAIRTRPLAHMCTTSGPSSESLRLEIIRWAAMAILLILFLLVMLYVASYFIKVKKPPRPLEEMIRYLLCSIIGIVIGFAGAQSIPDARTPQPPPPRNAPDLAPLADPDPVDVSSERS